jgi:hypothetical protein
MLNLKNLCDSLRNVGAVDSQQGVSVLAGRRPSWFSSTIAHGRRPSTSALLTITHNLKEIASKTISAANETDDIAQSDAYRAGAAILQGWIQAIERELTRRIEHHET